MSPEAAPSGSQDDARQVRITGTTRCYPILGQPIAQVRTVPAINAFFAAKGIDAVMFPMEIAPARIDAVLAELRDWSNCGGASVTVPHKQAAFRACDVASGRATRIGAVNIIRREPDGTLVGDMTDGLAFVAALSENGIAIAGRRIVLAGAAGGAGAAIADALCEGGPAALHLVDPAAGRLAALATRLSEDYPGVGIACGMAAGVSFDLAVNASPLGMDPGDPLPIDLDRLTPGAAVCDVITKPAMTPLLVEALRRGHKVQTGHAMADVQLPFQMWHLGLWTDATTAPAGEPT